MRIIQLMRAIFTGLATAVLLLTLVACGSSNTSSSGGGTSGFSSISGNVAGGVAYHDSAPSESNQIVEFLQKAIAEAHASGVPGVTVQLLQGGMVIDTKTTDASGDFSFTELVPGQYSLSLMQNGQNVGNTPAIDLAANSNTSLEVNLSGSLLKVEVEAMNDQIAGEVEDDRSDDMDSADDMSEDEDSEDDLSEDEGSEDDVSDDESSDDDSDDDKPSVS